MRSGFQAAGERLHRAPVLSNTPVFRWYAALMVDKIGIFTEGKPKLVTVEIAGGAGTSWAAHGSEVVR